jgi:hypothetical protein
MTRAIAAEEVAGRLQPVQLLAAIFAPRDMRFGERRVRGIELAVDEPAEQQLLINARGHLLHTP